MKKRAARIIIFIVVSFFFLFVPFFNTRYIKTADALLPGGGGGTGGQTVTSNCIITKIGNAPQNPTLPPECNNVSATVQNVIKLAKEHLKTGTYIMGTPSRNWGADKSTGPNSPPNFDCSGFVGWAWYWGSNGKVSMIGQTNADWARSTPLYKKVVTSNESQLQPGDLVYFNDHLPYPQPFHVGLFIGKDTCGANDCFLEYSTTGQPGNESGIKQASGGLTMMGFIRINVP